jgi:cell division septation protein DedD
MTVRDKILLQIDRRQVPVLAIAALLLFGAAFALGVFIGKGLVSAAPAAQPVGNLEALDQRKDAAVAPVKAKADEAEAEAEREREREREKSAAAAKDKEAKKKAEGQKAAQRAKALQGAAAASIRQPGEEADQATGTPASSFTVQIGSSTNKAEADRIVQKARSAGLQPFVVEANLGQKGTWYRVRVGSFQDRADADKFRRDVERELGGRALVMPAR